MNWMSEFGRVGPCWKGFPNFALNKVHRPTLVTASSLQRDVTILQECVRQVSFAYSSPQQIPSNMLHFICNDCKVLCSFFVCLAPICC